jgi:hypothetical protein
MRPAHIVALAALALAAAIVAARASAQIAPSTPAPGAVLGHRPMAMIPMTPLTDIAVPYDQSEPVTGGAQLVTTAEDRAQTLQLLRNALALSNIRRHSYDWKTSFTSYGSSSSDGRWILEDISPSRNTYRWTAQGPNFSGVFLAVDRLLYSNQAGGAMPLRLAQVRLAMWGKAFQPIGAYAALRIATGDLNGAAVRCVLVARGVPGNARLQFSDGRSFAEIEYCVDPQSGLLDSYSPYPGVYIRYDYANAFHFHQMIIPDGFTVLENGQTIIQARTDSVTDAPTGTSNLFSTEGLNTIGVGQLIATPMVVRGFDFNNAVAAGSAPRVVTLHGMLSPEGQLSEVEILATTDPSIDAYAIEHASRHQRFSNGSNPQPGVSPHAREAVFTFEFVHAPANAGAQSMTFDPHAN